MAQAVLGASWSGARLLSLFQEDEKNHTPSPCAFAPGPDIDAQSTTMPLHARSVKLRVRTCPFGPPTLGSADPDSPTPRCRSPARTAHPSAGTRLWSVAEETRGCSGGAEQRVRGSEPGQRSLGKPARPESEVYTSNSSQTHPPDAPPRARARTHCSGRSVAVAARFFVRVPFGV